MNAETRAKELFDIIVDKDPRHWVVILTAAVTRAENDKLEEAARVAERAHLGMSCFVDAVDCGQFNSGVRHAAKAVRSLLEKD